ncbi:hypothetical protein [Polaromonas sp. OV174]|uniref:hypothetical protein n=1 Tax=Polaromonas sp. OV174 TaxID=1855300 RepID=UPI0011606E43|nr:hypothetical protein [Polaromonas sp. OV174]
MRLFRCSAEYLLVFELKEIKPILGADFVEARQRQGRESPRGLAVFLIFSNLGAIQRNELQQSVLLCAATQWRCFVRKIALVKIKQSFVTLFGG